MLFYLLAYLFGGVVTYFWLRNLSKIKSLKDVLFTAILSALIGVAVAFAVAKADLNLNQWFLALLVAASGVLISYKLFEKKK
jgi:drug/metabolite transporter (DMT)-like permease